VPAELAVASSVVNHDPDDGQDRQPGQHPDSPPRSFRLEVLEVSIPAFDRCYGLAAGRQVQLTITMRGSLMDAWQALAGTGAALCGLSRESTGSSLRGFEDVVGALGPSFTSGAGGAASRNGRSGRAASATAAVIDSDRVGDPSLD